MVTAQLMMHGVHWQSASVALLQASQMPMYKTKLCQKFMATGQCNRGDACSFAHGHRELRQPPPGGPRGPPGGPAPDMPGMGPGPGPGPMGMNPVSLRLPVLLSDCSSECFRSVLTPCTVWEVAYPLRCVGSCFI